MTDRNLYIELAEKLEYPGAGRLLRTPQKSTSGYLVRILKVLLTPEEGKLLLELPAQPDELARKLGLDEAVVGRKLEELEQRGLVFRTRKGFRFPGDVEYLHGISLSSAERFVSVEVLDLWQKFYEAEWCQARGKMYGELEHPLLRVIPARRAFQNSPEVSPSNVSAEDDLKGVFQRARLIAVNRCPCRRGFRRCNSLLEVCMSFDQGAEYIIRRGLSKSLSVEEALAIADLAEEAGLVHCYDIQWSGVSMCNCCSDCCLILNPGLRYGTLSRVLAKSHYRCTIDQDLCTGCQDCIEKCHFGAIEMKRPSTSSKKLKAATDPEKCYGCGVCVADCPPGAIRMSLNP